LAYYCIVPLNTFYVCACRAAASVAPCVPKVGLFSRDPGFGGGPRGARALCGAQRALTPPYGSHRAGIWGCFAAWAALRTLPCTPITHRVFRPCTVLRQRPHLGSRPPSSRAHNAHISHAVGLTEDKSFHSSKIVNLELVFDLAPRSRLGGGKERVVRMRVVGA
jgi:hypothetical protein